MAHEDDGGPIRVAINHDEVALSSIKAEVSSYFLKGSSGRWFDGKWLFGVGW